MWIFPEHARFLAFSWVTIHRKGGWAGVSAENACLTKRQLRLKIGGCGSQVSANTRQPQLDACVGILSVCEQVQCLLTVRHMAHQYIIRAAKIKGQVAVSVSSRMSFIRMYVCMYTLLSFGEARRKKRPLFPVFSRVDGCIRGLTTALALWELGIEARFRSDGTRSK